jgi:hypothetical protein
MRLASRQFVAGNGARYGGEQTVSDKDMSGRQGSQLVRVCRIMELM